jgi:hypothetical protein
MDALGMNEAEGMDEAMWEQINAGREMGGPGGNDMPGTAPEQQEAIA